MIASGSLVPGTANTATELASEYTPAAWISIQARSGNTGNITVGDSTITGSAGGNVLAKGQTLLLPYQGATSYDLHQVCALAATQGDGIDFNYGQ